MAVVRGRWRGVPRHQWVCEWCGLGLVEDERHFLDVCESWASERRGLWKSMTEVDKRAVGFVDGWPSHARMDWLLEGGSVRTKVVVVRKVGSWLAKRETLGGGKEGSRGWGEKPTMEGQRKVERRQALVVKGMAAEVAKAVQPLWTKLARTSALDFERQPFGL